MSGAKYFSSEKKLGILGGGQLGKMLLQKAMQWDINTSVLDPDKNAPCKHYTNYFEQGSLMDFDTVYHFGKKCHTLTIEIEHVNVEALTKLKEEGVIVHPNPISLSLIQDKGLQKIFYNNHHFPTADFILFDNKQSMVDAIEDKVLTIPFVQKTRKAGYDGKGVQVIKSKADIEKIWDVPSIAEKKIDIQYELAVIAVRNVDNQVVTYDPVFMEFHDDANLLDLLIFPAQIDTDIVKKTKEIAATLIQQLDICGLLAVEFLIDKNNQIYVNEIAPRPHNSGHQTIESCACSQYEHHLRGILNLPLVETNVIIPSAMVNLLGANGFEGQVEYKNIEECMQLEGIYIHLYGKKITRPYRKMGHVTVIHKDIKKAKETAIWVKNTIQVKSR